MKFCFQNLAFASLPIGLAFGCASTGVQSPTGEQGKQHRQVFDAQVTVSGGKYEHDIDGSFNDETDAGFLGVIIEGSSRSGFGGGISLEVMGSDDKLFENQGAAAQAATLEFAPFFLYRLRGGERFQMPIRVGPWLHVMTLDDQATSDSLEWASYGLRAAVEPEFAVIHSPNFDLTLFAGLSLAGGATRIQLDTAPVSDTFDSSAAAFGFEFGPRFRWQHFFAGVSFLHRGLSVAESDTQNTLFVRGVDTSYDGLAFTLGGGF